MHQYALIIYQEMSISDHKLKTIYQETFAKYSRYPKWRSPAQDPQNQEEQKIEEIYSLPKIASPTLRECVKNLFNAHYKNTNAEKHDQGIIARILIKNNQNEAKVNKIFNNNHQMLNSPTQSKLKSTSNSIFIRNDLSQKQEKTKDKPLKLFKTKQKYTNSKNKQSSQMTTKNTTKNTTLHKRFHNQLPRNASLKQTGLISYKNTSTPLRTESIQNNNALYDRLRLFNDKHDIVGSPLRIQHKPPLNQKQSSFVLKHKYYKHLYEDEMEEIKLIKEASKYEITNKLAKSVNVKTYNRLFPQVIRVDQFNIN